MGQSAVRTPSSDRSNRNRGLLAGVLIVLAGVAAWQLLGRAPEPAPVTRRSTDFLATWHCLDCQHEVEAPAAAGPQPCPKCGHSTSYASYLFECPQHGVLRVAFNYDERGKPTEVKVGSAAWAPRINLEKKTSGLVCPTCGASLAPREEPRPVQTSE